MIGALTLRWILAFYQAKHCLVHSRLVFLSRAKQTWSQSACVLLGWTGETNHELHQNLFLSRNRDNWPRSSSR